MCGKQCMQDVVGECRVVECLQQWSDARVVVNAVIGVVLTLAAVVMWWVKPVGGRVAASGCLAGGIECL